MYRSDLNFTDPNSFLPARWLSDSRSGEQSGERSDGNFSSDRKAALQPFSVGSRDCLGKKYVSPPPFLRSTHRYHRPPADST